MSRKKIHQHHFLAGIEQVMASKRVMQQSIFADQAAAEHALAVQSAEQEADGIPSKIMAQASQLIVRSLPAAALLVALLALGVALLK